MLILGIETSCDETAAAIVKDGTQVLSCVISSQRDRFAQSGGVIPEDAARQQVLCMLPVLHACLTEANITPNTLDAIAVTKGPGLLGSLLVGTTTARVLATLWKKPLIGVHHTLGHLSSTWLSDDSRLPIPDSQFPILTLSASGGHTDLWHRTSHTKGTLLGSTRDDAAGEAFDKGASLLGLPYPGGPSIAKAAESGDPHAYNFPLPLHNDPSLDFSFSGLKTSLRYLLRDLDQSQIINRKSQIVHIACSYQHALCAHLIDRILRALHRHPEIHEVHLVGGVSANTYLRTTLQSAITAQYPNIVLRHPSKIIYCTDNAAMIAAAGEFLVREHGEKTYESFETTASLPLAMAVAN
ncbi:MAG: O-sialoglycoprotein endopeptidase [Candidatus Peregrinibacteria bacterium Greene1014_49]|nr:MAG: O-sialoglycoprotein endopeptidase [Candidatus Peregrinibacteria bacterium Greene1014_49]